MSPLFASPRVHVYVSICMCDVEYKYIYRLCIYMTVLFYVICDDVASKIIIGEITLRFFR